MADLESFKKVTNAEADSRKQVRKSFYMNVSRAFMEELQHLVSKIGFYFDSEKEHYHVTIELNQVCHLVVEISCLYKDLDLRLMLVTKRKIKSFDDEENDGISKLTKSAVIDPDVKGGLIWPLGK